MKQRLALGMIGLIVFVLLACDLSSSPSAPPATIVYVVATDAPTLTVTTTPSRTLTATRTITGTRTLPSSAATAKPATRVPTKTPTATAFVLPTSRPLPTYAPIPTASSGSGGRVCCKYCTTGIPCGNSCISASKICRQPPGCA